MSDLTRDVTRALHGEPEDAQPRRSWHSRALTLVWPLPRLSLWLVVLAFVSWEGTLGRFSTASRVSVGAAIAATIVTALVTGWGRQRKSSATWARDGLGALAGDITGRGRGRAPAAVIVGVAAWTVLVAATIGWDLYSFSHQLHSLPTLSRLVGDVTRHMWGRGVIFALWVALGVYLAVGWRHPRGAASRPGAARRRGVTKGTGVPRPARPFADPHETAAP